MNFDEIIDFINFTKTIPISVRFIEEMPFNHKNTKLLNWDYVHILEHIQTLKDTSHSTSINYTVKNFVGSFGIISAYSRSFCNTCNRIRITPQGFLKTCLYEKRESQLLPLLRESNMKDKDIAMYIQDCILQKPVNGFEAQQQSTAILEAMNRVGG
ncbi:MAG: hypothetical protein ACRCR9_01895 [Chitinophagaceae bacterium]